MDHLMVLMMASFRDYCMETHWDILTVKCMDMMMESNWDLLMVKCLELYLEMYMESYLGLMLEHSWAL